MMNAAEAFGGLTIVAFNECISARWIFFLSSPAHERVLLGSPLVVLSLPSTTGRDHSFSLDLTILQKHKDQTAGPPS